MQAATSSINPARSLWGRRVENIHSRHQKWDSPEVAQELSLGSRHHGSAVSAKSAATANSAQELPFDEREVNLRKREESLEEKENIFNDTEKLLKERERDLWEAEALFEARKNVATANDQRKANAGSNEKTETASKEEQDALEALRVTLEEQVQALKEEQTQLREREVFLEESENKLFDKFQIQQEKETELEQREEDLFSQEK